MITDHTGNLHEPRTNFWPACWSRLMACAGPYATCASTSNFGRYDQPVAHAAVAPSPSLTQYNVVRW